jgi:ABC-type nitrate/sulfonate/bicarbonate transport system permease component
MILSAERSEAVEIAQRQFVLERRKDRIYQIGVPVVVGLATLALWQLLASFVFNKLTLPNLQSTVVALVHLTTDGELLQAVIPTLRDWMAGLAAAMVLGTVIAILMARLQWVHDVLDLYVHLLVSAPVIVFVPFVVIVLGFGELSAIIIVFLFVIANVIVTVEAGVRSASRAHIEMARSFSASERQIFRLILLPSSIPAVMAALRAATSRAFLGALIAELTLISGGLGGLLDKYGGSFQTDYVFAAILAAGILGIASVHGARYLEHRASRYYRIR